jgi:hypothetical protein
MQEVCSVIDPLIKTESSLMPLQTVILGAQQPMNPNQIAPSQQNGQSPVVQPKMPTNCDKTRENAYWMPTETGFINSQPSMAEFLTHLGPDSSPKMEQGSYGTPSHDGDPVPEYPWMKEKKTARKNNSQSESLELTNFFFNNFLKTKDKCAAIFHVLLARSA